MTRYRKPTKKQIKEQKKQFDSFVNYLSSSREIRVTTVFRESPVLEKEFFTSRKLESGAEYLGIKPSTLRRYLYPQSNVQQYNRAA